jgi:hypothetical protein
LIIGGVGGVGLRQMSLSVMGSVSCHCCVDHDLCQVEKKTMDYIGCSESLGSLMNMDGKLSRLVADPVWWRIVRSLESI